MDPFIYVLIVAFLFMSGLTLFLSWLGARICVGWKKTAIELEEFKEEHRKAMKQWDRALELSEKDCHKAITERDNWRARFEQCQREKDAQICDLQRRLSELRNKHEAERKGVLAALGIDQELSL